MTNASWRARMEFLARVVGLAVGADVSPAKQKQKKQSSITKRDGLKQKQNLGGTMSFEEFRISKRGENDCSYADWQEWLRKRGIDVGYTIENPSRRRIERGGDNFSFVCWGDITELNLWEPR